MDLVISILTALRDVPGIGEFATFGLSIVSFVGGILAHKKLGAKAPVPPKAGAE